MKKAILILLLLSGIASAQDPQSVDQVQSVVGTNLVITTPEIVVYTNWIASYAETNGDIIADVACITNGVANLNDFMSRWVAYEADRRIRERNAIQMQRRILRRLWNYLKSQ